MSKMQEKRLYRSHSKQLFLFLGLITLLVLMTNFASSALSDDIVSYWKFDEQSGTAIDQLGVNNITNNGASNTTGKIIYAYDYDGTSDYMVTGGNIGITGTQNRTLNMWIKFDAFTGGPYFIAWGINSANREFGLRTDASGNLYAWTNAGDFLIKSTLSTGTWYMLTLTYDGTTVKGYVNGTAEGSSNLALNTGDSTMVIGKYQHGSSNYFNGIIDEVMISNKTLSNAQILELYNGGNGTSYPFPDITTISITLTSPSNDTTISDVGSNFTIQYNMTGSNSYNYTFKNSTYYVWLDNGTLFNETTTTDILNENNTIDLQFIDSFTFGTYIWDVYACYGNATFNNCTWSDNGNFTFDVVPFSVLDENYDNVTLEGSTNTFDINISVISGERLSTLKFVYNGVEYGGSFTEYNTNEYYATYNLKTPTLSGAIQNYTFYWVAELESGYEQNSTLHNQTVVKIYLDDCSTYTYQLLNFTVHDEITKNILNGITDNVNIKIDFELSYLDNSEQIIQYANEYSTTNPARVCMQNQSYNSSLRMDAVVEYSSTERFTEFYNIQNFVFNSTTSARNISLYDLNSSVGQEFKVTYRGIDYIPVADLIIQIQRKYIEDGQFRTVEIPMSGSNGYTIAHLVPNNVIYNLIFIKDGVILDSFLNVIATCQNPTFTECEINLNNEVSGEDLFDLIETENFFSSLSYDRITRVISSTFGLYDGTSGTATLQVYLADNIGTTQVCNDTLTGAGGTLSCIVPTSIGNSTVYAVVLFDGEVEREGFINLEIKPKDLWGDGLIFGILIIFLFLVGMGLTISGSDGITYGLFLIIGMILLTAVNLLYTKSWIGTGASILWLLIAIIMVMVKSGSKR